MSGNLYLSATFPVLHYCDGRSVMDADDGNFKSLSGRTFSFRCHFWLEYQFYLDFVVVYGVDQILHGAQIKKYLDKNLIEVE